MNLLKRLFVEEEGQGLVEYALIIALVGVALAAALITFRTQIEGVFTNIQNSLSGAQAGG